MLKEENLITRTQKAIDTYVVHLYYDNLTGIYLFTSEDRADDFINNSEYVVEHYDNVCDYFKNRAEFYESMRK